MIKIILFDKFKSQEGWECSSLSQDNTNLTTFNINEDNIGFKNLVYINQPLRQILYFEQNKVENTNDFEYVGYSFYKWNPITCNQEILFTDRNYSLFNKDYTIFTNFLAGSSTMNCNLLTSPNPNNCKIKKINFNNKNKNAEKNFNFINKLYYQYKNILQDLPEGASMLLDTTYLSNDIIIEINNIEYKFATTNTIVSFNNKSYPQLKIYNNKNPSSIYFDINYINSSRSYEFFIRIDTLDIQVTELNNINENYSYNLFSPLGKDVNISTCITNNLTDSNDGKKNKCYVKYVCGQPVIVNGNCGKCKKSRRSRITDPYKVTKKSSTGKNCGCRS